MFGQGSRYNSHWVDGTSFECEHSSNHVKIYVEYKGLVVAMVTAVGLQSNKVTDIDF